MNRSWIFWGSAVLFAVLFTLAVPYLLPHERIGLTEEWQRHRAWLLTVFCTGVMFLLFGASSLIAPPRLVGIREVVEAGNVGRAIEAAHRSNREIAAGRGRNSAAWVVAAGAALIACYIVLWRVLA